NANAGGAAARELYRVRPMCFDYPRGPRQKGRGTLGFDGVTPRRSRKLMRSDTRDQRRGVNGRPRTDPKLPDEATSEPIYGIMSDGYSAMARGGGRRRLFARGLRSIMIRQKSPVTGAVLRLRKEAS